MDLQIGNPQNAWWLSLVVVGVLATGFSIAARRRALRHFLRSGAENSELRSTRMWMSSAMTAASLALIVAAAMDIRWGKTWREVPQKGIEVMFVLDVSRSMLAEDATPNRLVRAKQQIKDLVDEMAGDRVGLITFAGETRQSVPLTSHYEDLKQTLDSVGPHTVRTGGSRLGDAIEAAGNAFLSKTNNHKVIVIFTDGEDQESQPVDVAKTLHKEKGIRIFTVGLGDMDQGARIPDEESRSGGFIQYEGQQVWSKMNGQILKEIASVSDGAYIPAGTKRVNMADVYHSYVANVEQTEFETAKINAYIPRFQWFAVPALILTLLESFLSTRSRTARKSISAASKTSPGLSNDAASAQSETHRQGGKNSQRTSQATRTVTTAAWSVLCLTVSSPSLLAADPVDEVDHVTKINAANELVRQGKYDDAIREYQRLSSTKAFRDDIDFQLGVANYRKGELSAAEQRFAEASESTDTKIAAEGRYNLGNCRYASALQIAETDKPRAIERLKQSIDNFRSSLRLDPDNVDARANIELAAHLIRQLEDQQQQDQQQQDQQQQDQQQQDQQQQDQQQQDQQQQDQQQQDQQQQDQQQQDQQQQDQQNSDSQSDESQSLNEGSQSEDMSQGQESESPPQADRQRPPSPSSKSDPSVQQQRQENQQQAESRPGEENSDDEHQEVPSGQLSSAGEKDETPPASGSAGMASQMDDQGLMTKEEALKMLQAVRDRDMLRRLQQAQRERSRHVPVDRDW